MVASEGPRFSPTPQELRMRIITRIACMLGGLGIVGAFVFGFEAGGIAIFGPGDVASNVSGAVGLFAGFVGLGFLIVPIAKLIGMDDGIEVSGRDAIAAGLAFLPRSLGILGGVLGALIGALLLKLNVGPPVSMENVQRILGAKHPPLRLARWVTFGMAAMILVFLICATLQAWITGTPFRF